MTTVLCVEDDRDSALLLEHILQSRGYVFISIADAETAIEIAIEEQPDLILMDILLPGIDGIEATAILKSTSETAHIPIIAVTAHSLRPTYVHYREAGFDDYQTKPFTPDDLLQRIQRVLSVNV